MRERLRLAAVIVVVALAATALVWAAHGHPPSYGGCFDEANQASDCR